jgi:hypothetical protein
MGSGEQSEWEGGDMRIDNNSQTPYRVTLQYSEATSREPEVEDYTPTPPETLGFGEPVAYEAPAETLTAAGVVAHRDSEGFVKARATVGEMDSIEIWIETPVRDFYEVDITADGTVTWAYFGTE